MRGREGYPLKGKIKMKKCQQPVQHKGGKNYDSIQIKNHENLEYLKIRRIKKIENTLTIMSCSSNNCMYVVPYCRFYNHTAWENAKRKGFTSLPLCFS